LKEKLSGDGAFQIGNVSVDVSACKIDQSATGPATLGARSEDVSIVEPGSLNSIKGTLSVMELLGSDALGWFTWTGGRVRVRLSIEAARALPRDVGLRVDTAKASFIFKENGRRL
jgi:multiple sugar transport system ATP-binding protein